MDDVLGVDVEEWGDEFGGFAAVQGEEDGALGEDLSLGAARVWALADEGGVSRRKQTRNPYGMQTSVLPRAGGGKV